MLHKIMREGGFSFEQLYNADETGLFWRVLPNKTLLSCKKIEVAKRSDNPPCMYKCHRSTQIEACNDWEVQEAKSL